MSTHHYIIPDVDTAAPALPQSKLLYITTSRHSSDWNHALHTNICSELFFITGGCGCFQVQESSFPVFARDLVVINPGVPHAESSQSASPMEYTVLGVEGLDIFSDTGSYVLLHLRPDWEELMSCLQLILRAAKAARPNLGAVCQRLLEIILLRLLQVEAFSLSPEQSSRRSISECEVVRRYIDHHFKENLTLDQLAAVAHINKFYLVHTFRKEFNTTPISYLIVRRIQESRFLLAETDHPLSQIAQLLGFSSLSYFSQSFRRLEGISPKEYRKRHRR